MTKFVIRSMSTTNYEPAWGNLPAQKSEPYHIYLLPAEERSRAFWATKGRAQTFWTIAEAQAEIARALRDQRYPSQVPDVVPVDDRFVPTYWDARKAKCRMVGTAAVSYEHEAPALA